MKRMKKTSLIGLLLVCVMAFAAGCNGGAAPTSEENSDEKVQKQTTKGGGDVPGVTDTTIKLAHLNDYSGPGVYPGEGMTDAINAYVEYVNNNGGIHGRMLEVIHEDNQYTPAGSVTAAKKVITQDRVFAIPLSMGSAPTIAIKDYVNDEGVPTMGAGEATEFFEPPTKYLFGVGTSYINHAGVAVKYIAETLSKDQPAKIALMGQDDTFGTGALQGAEEAAKYYDNIKIVYSAFHKRDQVDMSDQITQLKDSGAEYLLIATPVARTANILQGLANQKVKLKAIFGISGVVTDQKFFELAGYDYVDIYWGTNSYYGWDQVDQPSIQRAMDILKETGNEDVIEKKNTYFWHAWNNFNLFVKALELAGEDLTRDGVVEALESITGEDEQIGTLPSINYDSEKRMSGNSAFIVKAKRKGDSIIWDQQTDFLKPPFVK